MCLAPTTLCSGQPGATPQGLWAKKTSALSALNTYVKRQVLDRRPPRRTPYNRLAANGVAFCSRPSIESDAMTQSHLLKDCARNQRKLPVLFPSAVAGTPCQSVRAVASLFQEMASSIAARRSTFRPGTREVVSRVPVLPITAPSGIRAAAAEWSEVSASVKASAAL